MKPRKSARKHVKKSGKSRLNPRKLPQQSRSVETCQIILEAAARILVNEGYENTNTNKIAAEAGISIGSLYQYFPNKEVIIGLLVERQFSEELALIEPRLKSASNYPLETVVRELIQAIIEMHSVKPELRKIINEQVPRVGKVQELMDIEARIAKQIEEALKKRTHEIRPENLEMAAFIIVHAVEANVHSALKKHQSWLSKNSEFSSEISELVLNYLKR